MDNKNFSRPLFLLFTMCCVFAGLPVDRAAAVVPPGYGLVFNENFNGSSITDTMFGYQWTGYPGVRATTDAVSVSGGYLTLTTYSTNAGGTISNWGGCVATENYNGGNRQWTYGYIESRLKFDNDKGNVMAFWMVSDAMFNGSPAASVGNEVDIIEHRQTDTNNFNIPTTDHMAIHWGGYGGSGQQNYKNVTISGLEGGFHTFGLLWTSTSYQFYVDENLKWTVTSQISHGPEWIILDSDPCGGWAGTTPSAGYGDLGSSVTKMTVDYVRVYQVPEPSSLVLVGIAAFALLARRKGHKRLSI
jgi:beta-glucanase (GH16 family)